MDKHIDVEGGALGYTEKDGHHRKTLLGSVLQGKVCCGWKQCGLEGQILSFCHPPSPLASQELLVK